MDLKRKIAGITALCIAFSAGVAVSPQFSRAAVKFGDINNDGYIDASDASLILAYYAYASTTSGTPLSLEAYIARENGEPVVTTTAPATTTAQVTTVPVTTSAETTAAADPAATGGTIYNANGVIVHYQGIIYNERFKEIQIQLYIENNNDHDIRIQADDFSINGFKTSKIFSSDIAAGQKVNDEIYVFVSKLSDNNITKIENIETKFNIVELKDGAIDINTLITTEPVTIITDYDVPQ